MNKLEYMNKLIDGNIEEIESKFITVVANPPYSTEWDSHTELLKYDDRFKDYGKLAPAKKADYAFVQHMIYHLDDNGTMAVVLPHGVLFRGAAIMLNRKRMVIEPFLIDNNTMSYSFSTHWDTNFGNIFFQTLNLPKYAQVGALPSYNSKDIGTISVNLPSLNEQEKIGNFFGKIDDSIEKQSSKIGVLKQHKKSFLQKMFV